MNARKRQKQIGFGEAGAFFEDLRLSGKRIVQCHGTFDLVHPGHLIHFEEARSFGDILVVTFTAAEHVKKGPDRPFFNDQLRAKSLAALECVDYVVLVPHPTGIEAIQLIRPHVYCKGQEYADPRNDVTGKISDEVQAAESVGAKVEYAGSVVFSSTRLLNQNFQGNSPEVVEFCRSLSRQCSADQFRDYVEGFSKVRVLVIGDIIFDRYTTVNLQGVSSKSKVLSGRFLHEETHPGGALAVYRHLKEFAIDVKLIGLVGSEVWLEELLSRHVARPDDSIVRVPGFTTVVKQRWVEPRANGDEISQLFSVNYVDDEEPERAAVNSVLQQIEEQIRSADLVLMMDFGHGLAGREVRRLVQEKASFLFVNCQANSNNYGFNLINKRYRRVDGFSLGLRELQLARGSKKIDPLKDICELHDELGARYSWLTLGSAETIGVKRGEGACRCVALEKKVVDPLGAGDALCSVAALGAASGLPLPVATLMSQIAGAQAVRIVGNASPIEKNRFIKSGMTLLNF